MNGKPDNWSPADGQLDRLARKQRFVRDVIHFVVIAVLMLLFFGAIALSPAEAARRFVQRSSGSCPNGQCAVKQQAVVVQHVQKVVAAPVVHHAAQVVAPVVAAPVYAQPTVGVQNNWYAVGQPLVQHAQLVAAAKDALAEQQFKATFQGSFQGSINGAAQQQFYQQQPVYSPPQPQQPAPAPQWQPPATQPHEPVQPPAEPMPPDAPPQYSMTMPPHPLFDADCAKCHANGAKKGGFAIESMTRDQLAGVIDAIREGRMPKGGALPTDKQLALIAELTTLP